MWGGYDYLDVAIAYDEKDRQKQLNAQKRSILVEKQITEKQATNICIENQLYSPHYEYSSRDGCVLCFNAKPIERKIWIADYPQAQAIVIDMQKALLLPLFNRPNRYPLRDYKLFIDTDQVDMFGNYTIN